MKILRIIFSILFISILFSSSLSAQKVRPEKYGLSSETLEQAAERMKGFVEDGKYPFIATMIQVNGVVVDRRTFGYDDPGKRKRVRDDAIYRIYSMTKPVTAAALMILYDEGLFQLDDPVYKYIPEFEHTKVYTPNGLVAQKQPMTISNLLTHTSGMTYGWDQNAYVDSLYRVNRELAGRSVPLAEVVKKLASLPLKYQPGTRFEYSMSIDVAGYLVEVLSGQPFDEFLSERLFDPLKMEDTGFYVPEEKKDRLARVYYRRRDQPLQTPDNPSQDSFLEKPVYFSGGGGLVSTMDDYARFANMLVNGGELEGVRILQKETVDLMLSNHLPAGAKGREGHYALGGRLYEETGAYGWGGAASTTFKIYPEQNMIVLCFTQLMPTRLSFADMYLGMVEYAMKD